MNKFFSSNIWARPRMHNKKLQSHFYNKKFTILENCVWVVTRNSMCSKNSCFFDEKFWFANLQKVYPSRKNSWDTKRACPTKKMSYQHMFDNEFTKICLYISSWDVTKCSFMSITETYKWFFIIGFYLRVVKMLFSLREFLTYKKQEGIFVFQGKHFASTFLACQFWKVVGWLYKSFVRRKICISDATKSSLISNYNFWITHNSNFRENMMPQKITFFDRATWFVVVHMLGLRRRNLICIQ